jgi:hypothetical protein
VGIVTRHDALVAVRRLAWRADQGGGPDGGGPPPLLLAAGGDDHALRVYAVAC